MTASRIILITGTRTGTSTGTSAVVGEVGAQVAADLDGSKVTEFAATWVA
jgi:Na+/H+ antiporter NhaC